MKYKALVLATSFFVCAFAAPSLALKAGGMFEERNGAFYEQKSTRRSNLGAGSYTQQTYKPKATRQAYYPAKRGVGKRPRKWCGWWMRTQLGGGPEFNVAWNWRKYGRPTSAQIGAVVIWRHHVGIITGRTANGRWIVKSGNDGGRVRERARSVKGAIFRI
ncbi:MAG: hypothetical protein RIC14_13925 [Filomicrobium sp.]